MMDACRRALPGMEALFVCPSVLLSFVCPSVRLAVSSFLCFPPFLDLATFKDS